MKTPALALLLAALPLVGCEAGGEADVDAAAEAPAEAAEPSAPAQPATASMRSLPDTTADAVWAYLRDVAYADEWRMWPGKDAFYEGTEPHGMLLTTYLNQTAYDALVDGSGPLPAGSIVVKENYTPDSTLAAVTVMFSSDGYDPEFNDWFWAKYGPDGGVEAAGRVEGCQTCHSAGERGFLRTPYEPGADGGR